LPVIGGIDNKTGENGDDKDAYQPDEKVEKTKSKVDGSKEGSSHAYL